MKKSTRFIPLSYDLNHRPIGIDVIEWDSGKPGPYVYLQASVHGAELQGNLVIQQLLDHLNNIDTNELHGKIVCVPFANPWGTSELLGAGTYGRFDAITGKNWNRAYHELYDEQIFQAFIEKMPADSPKLNQEFFKMLTQILESKVAQKENYGIARSAMLTYELQKMSLSADIFLDLHTAPIAGLYVYAPEYLQEQVKDLGYPINLIIPPEFADAGDEAHFTPWVKLAEHYQKSGAQFKIPAESYTLELGSEENVCSDLAKQQFQHILQLLHRRGVFKTAPKTQISPGKFQQLKHYKTYHAPFGGLCEYLAKPGQEVQAGDEIAKITYYNHETACFNSVSVTAKVPSIVVNHFSTSNIQAGTEIYQLLENPLNY